MIWFIHKSLEMFGLRSGLDTLVLFDLDTHLFCDDGHEGDGASDGLGDFGWALFGALNEVFDGGGFRAILHGTYFDGSHVTDSFLGIGFWVWFFQTVLRFSDYWFDAVFFGATYVTPWKYWG